MICPNGVTCLRRRAKYPSAQSVSEATREDGRADDLLRHTENPPPLELRQQHHHEQRHEEDAHDGERVGQVHEAADTT